MKTVLPLFVFIDACGWEIIKDDPFGRDFAPWRRRLESVFGYSSACVPSILSGRWPVEHRNWSYFVYDPQRSPFKSCSWLRFLPEAVTSRRRVRRLLSRLIKARLGFHGYFDLYNMPFRHLPLFDFTEKKSPLRPAGMNQGDNIFDFLISERIPYHVSAPERGEGENLDALIADIRTEKIDFAFLYWPGLDALLHRVGNQSSEIPEKLRSYEQQITRLLNEARQHYSDIRLYVFSDHGMANCDHLLDLQAQMKTLSSRFGRDYAAVYDSTMARFWFFNELARAEIVARLGRVPEGRILPDDELEEMGTLFRDRYFGELIFLVREGVLMVPSHMGQRPIRAMHGYHPSEPQSYAALCTNLSELPEEITAIPDVYRLMVRDARLAAESNRQSFTGAKASR